MRRTTKHKSNISNWIPAFAGMTVVLVGLAFWLLHPQNAAAAWFDTNWDYRQAVTVTVSSNGSDITNLETLITVNTSAISTKLQGSCQDLRFTSVSGKLLPYYIDSGCTTTTTKIWVMVDKVPKNTTTYTMYMYYGNPAAVAGTDPVKFRLFNGLVGYWPMNEASWNGTAGEVKDYSVSAVNGIAACDGGGCIKPSTTTGLYGNAGSFNGSSQYAFSSDSALPSGSTNRTISLWYNLSSAPTAGQTFALVVYGSGVNTSYAPFINNTGGTTVIGVSIGGTTVSRVISAPSTGTWYHLEVTHTSAGVITFYLNGVQQGTAGSLTLNTTLGGFNIIGRNFTAANYFPGQLDDVRIYNRILSTAELVALDQNPGNIASNAFLNTNPTTSFASEEQAPGPTMYWKFDEGTGTSAKDSSSNANTGTLGGSTLPTWQTEDQSISGKSLFFDGTSSKVTGSVIAKAIKTIGFWIKPDTIANQGLVNLDGGTHVISTNGSGVITATGFTSPTYYINGVAQTTPTLVINQWSYVEITTGTSFDSTNSFTVGTDGTNFIKGFFDEVKFYNYARSSAQAQADFTSRGSLVAAGETLGASTQSNINALNQGLVGYWKMDESSGNAADSSGNGNTGTNTNTATYTAGKYGNGGTFAGASSQYFSAGNPTNLQITNNITISTWAKFSTSQASRPFIAKWTGASPSYYLGISTTSNKPYFGISNGSNQTSPTTSNSMNDGVWHHYVGTYDGSKINLYLDGNLVGSTNYTGSFNSSSANVTIGSYDAFITSESFTGSLDETRIYNRALSPADVTNLYTFAPGPTGYWNFEEKTGSSVNDRSGSANTGTWQGTLGAQWTTGKDGAGGSFNGTNNYVQVANDAANLSPEAGDFTVEAWVKDSNLDSTDRRIYVDHGSSANNIILLGVSTSNRFTALYRDSANNSVSANANSITIAANTWYHLAAVRQGTNVTLYVNGAVAGTGTGTLGTISTSTGSPPRIGTNDNSSANFWQGAIDDVKTYNYALSARQITIDMSGGGSSVNGGRSAGPLGYWKFDDGYGTTAINSGSGGTALNGTLTGMATAPSNSTSGWWAGGKFGKTLEFDHTNDYVVVSGNPAPLQITSNLTLSAWYATVNNATAHDIIAKDGASGQFGYRLYTDNAGKLNMEVSSDGTATTTVTGTTTITNNWVHVVGVYVPGVSMTLYINGRLEKQLTTSIPASIKNSSANVNIGGQNSDGSTNLMLGMIDEPKIYNYDLSPAEVLLDYNHSASLSFSAIGTSISDGKTASNSATVAYCVPGDTSTCNTPLAEYNFEEKTGSSVNDTSSNTSAGTWQGTLGSQWTTGKYGTAGNFNGIDNYVSVTSTLTGVKSVGFWVYPTATTNYFIDFDGGTHYITASSGTVSATGFTSPTIYVNGQVSSTITANAWQYIEVTTGTSFNSTNPLTIGKANGSNFMSGKIDQVRVFNYVRSGAQIAWDFNRGAPSGWWKMDDCQGSVATDSSANNNPGTINLSTTGTQTTAIGMGTCTTNAVTPWFNGAVGKTNASLNFDGTNDYVDAGTASYLAPGTGDYSVSLWAKPTDLTCTNHCGLISSAASDVASGHQGFELFEGSAGGGLRVEYSDGTTQIDSGNQVLINNNAWNHIVLILSPTLNHTYIYLNGVLKYTRGTYGVAGSVTNNHLLIGLQDLADTTADWTGQIDDVRVFNYALTQPQINNLYNNGATARFAPGTGAP